MSIRARLKHKSTTYEESRDKIGTKNTNKTHITITKIVKTVNTMRCLSGTITHRVIQERES